MTGEMTLRGRVLPIGGLKEKTMAAYRAGIRTVLVPEDNTADLAEIDPVVREALEFIPVKTVDRVWEIALASRHYCKSGSPGAGTATLAEPAAGSHPMMAN